MRKILRKSSRRAYFIGISGKTPSSLAKELRENDWEISGSDHERPYPPASSYLVKNKIGYFKGYQEKNVPENADLVIVGRGALINNPQNPEYLKAKSLGLKVVSLPEALEKFVVKENSIVIAGTYGKTTLTALVAWILRKAGFNPSFGIGGEPSNMGDGVKITNSAYSVVEGDEAPALQETDPPKFMFYKPKYLLLTATKWDHPEIYKSEKAYLKAFIGLVKLLPKDGLLVYNLDNVNQEVVSEAVCRKASYSLKNDKADYFVRSYSHKESGIYFQLNKNFFKSQALLLGKANLENICGAITLCMEIGIDKRAIDSAVRSFRGIKTRLEFLGKLSEKYFYWDIAQHPEKVRGSLEALKEHYPKKRIICVFDPETTGLKYKESLKWYPGAFDAADSVIVGRVGYLRNLRGKERISGVDIVKAISKTQKNVFYQPIDEKITEYLTKQTKSEEVIVFMSSGGLRFTNLIERVAAFFKKSTKK